MRNSSVFDDTIELPLTSRQQKRNQRKIRRNSGVSSTTQPRDGGLKLKSIKPMTYNQSEIFDQYEDDFHLLVHGFAGTGKTFLACYLGVKDILENKKYEKVILVRSTVATRDIGFLPGSKKEKIKEYEAPYIDIFSKLFGRGDAYEILKTKNIVEFIPTSFIRGITIDNAIVIVDEIQNMSWIELDSILTRLGDNAKIILCGDFRQSDLKFADERRGLIDFMDVLKNMKEVATVEMTVEDIVRSGFVKSYIITKTHQGK